jgi:hypothetical protein
MIGVNRKQIKPDSVRPSVSITKKGDPMITLFSKQLKTMQYTSTKEFTQCKGLGNPCTGKEP